MGDWGDWADWAEFRNFMNTWSQEEEEEQQLNSLVNRLLPREAGKNHIEIIFQSCNVIQITDWNETFVLKSLTLCACKLSGGNP